MNLLNPNKETLKVIKNARANERKIMREFALITQSQFRGETVEDRIVQMQGSEEPETFDEDALQDIRAKTSSVHQLTRLDHVRPVAASKQEVTDIKVKEATADTSIFTEHEDIKIKEFDYED